MTSDKSTTNEQPSEDGDSKAARAPILVELVSRSGQATQVALDPVQLAERSAEALNSAMSTVRSMAARAVEAVSQLHTKPSSMELEFGLKLTAEGNAIISKAAVEGSVKVKLTWNSNP